MTKRPTSLLPCLLLLMGWPAAAHAADLGELSKYLGFIEGFQHFFEFCQAETKLPEKLVKYSRDHIGERRAFIFAGLDETERAKISADAQSKKQQMVAGMMQYLLKDQPGKNLKQLCQTEGFFGGVVESEMKAQDKETAAIRKAKS